MKFSKIAETHPNASVYIQMYPNVSERVRKLRKTSENLKRIPQIREKIEKNYEQRRLVRSALLLLLHVGQELEDRAVPKEEQQR